MVSQAPTFNSLFLPKGFSQKVAYFITVWQDTYHLNIPGIVFGFKDYYMQATRNFSTRTKRINVQRNYQGGNKEDHRLKSALVGIWDSFLKDRINKPLQSWTFCTLWNFLGLGVKSLIYQSAIFRKMPWKSLPPF